MMPETHHLAIEHARSLQIRLNHGRLDPITAATEARKIFENANDRVRARWLDLELNGYGNLVDSKPLHAVLGVTSNDRLAAHVAAYRTQRGVEAAGHEFRHFFVEPLADLVATSTSVATLETNSSLELEFATSKAASAHPNSGSFGRDIFERIVGGFVAALHLQLGTLTK